MDQSEKSFVPSSAMVFNKVAWLEHYSSEHQGTEQSSAEQNGAGPSGASSRASSPQTAPGDALKTRDGTSGEGMPEALEGEPNFVPDKKGKCHGLIHAKTLSMGRLGAQNGERFMFGTVVSVAQHPALGLVIVGWQPHAELMMRRRINEDTGREYNYRAPAEFTVVLPVEERSFVIPQGVGGMGKSMMAYSVDAKGKLLHWARQAAEMMNSYGVQEALEV